MSLSTTGHDRKQSSFVVAHPDLVRALPEPEAEWVGHDLHAVDSAGAGMAEHFSDLVQRLSANGVIRHVRQEYRDGRLVTVWRTDAEAYRHAERRCDGRETLPCGHRAGFVNEGGRYQCGCAICDAEYERATVAEVFG